MKVVSYYPHLPRLQEMWLMNELESFEKQGIDFLIPYYSDSNKYLKKQKIAEKYIRYYLRIPKAPKNKILWFLYKVYQQYRVFKLYPVKYIKFFLWLIFHFDYTFLRTFCWVANIIVKLGLYNADIYISHGVFEPSVMAFVSGKFFSKPLVLIVHSIFDHPPYLRVINLNSSFILVKANYIKKAYVEKYPYISSEKVVVLPWGINTNYFKPSKKSYRKKNSEFTIITISRLVEMKGLIFLLKACKILMCSNIKFRCIVIGDGPEKKHLLIYIYTNNLSNFIEMRSTMIHSKRLLNAFSSADLFVLPSIVDSKGEVDVIPNAILEAMAMELPVITTKVGGMHEVIEEGINGFFVKEKDELDLATMIKIIMKLPVEKRREIGRKARETVVSNWDKDKLGRKFIEFLKLQIKNYAK